MRRRAARTVAVALGVITKERTVAVARPPQPRVDVGQQRPAEPRAERARGVARLGEG